jgi:uncharacterized protein YjdB
VTLSDATSGGTWTSGNTSVATVSATGVVTGVSAGTSSITYAVGTGCSVTTVVTINAGPSAISGTASVCLGSTTALTDGGGGTWTSSNTAAATVGSGTGIVTGVSAPSTATITYTLSTGCYTTTVVAVNMLPSSITGTATVCPGLTTTLSDATGGGAWSSSDTTIATVGTGTGVVTGVAGGTVTISYTLGTSCAATKVVTVNSSPSAISGTTTLCGGTTTTLTDAVAGGTWSTSNAAVASIGSSSGFLTAVSNGTAIISYTASCGFTTTTVTVGGAPVITAVTPNIDTVGDALVISGSNFNSTPSSNIVYFGATLGTVTAATSTSLTVTVPTGGTYKPITVENTGCVLTAYAQYPFLPTYNNSAYIPTTIAFNTHVDFTSGTNPFSIAIGDIDGDGKADLVTGNYGANSISVFRNTSTSGTITSGSFAAKVDFTAGASAYGVAIGDLDNDGKLDVVVTNNASVPPTVSVFRNTATSGVINSSSLAAKVDFGVGTGPIAVAISDLDMDGKADLAVANNGANTVSLLRNTSTSGSITSGSFAAKVDLTAGSHPFGIAVGDLDGDGKPDLAVPNQAAATVSVFRNTSSIGSITSGSFAAKVDFTTGSQPYGATIADIDGDGKMDLVVPNNGAASVSVLRNTATSGTIAAGSFASKVDFTTGAGPYCVAIGDINGDSKADLVVANRTAGTVSILRNTATSGTITSGSFAAKVDAGTGSNPVYVAVGDLDGDGKPDVATANISATTISILRNNPPFHPAPHSTTTTSPVTMCVGASVTLNGVIGTGGAWRSSNESIAEVDPATGVVKGMLAGRATVTYTLTDATGETIAVTPVIVNPLPGTIAIKAFPGTNIQPGQTVTFTAIVQNTNSLPVYQWQVNGVAVTSATSATFASSRLADKDVVTCIVGSNGCDVQAASNALTIGIIKSVDNQVIFAGSDVRILPNPNNGSFAIKGSLGVVTDEEVSMEITDMLGQVVYKTTIAAKNGQIDEQVQLDRSLANGMYLLNLHSGAENKVFHFVLRK